ncbi:MAG: dCMP deaminase, partial [Candidatus Magnetoglobus multicellularis str. Araruama]
TSRMGSLFLRIISVVRERATCLKRKVGALIVKNKRILASGYNGAPSGIEHCNKTGCLRQQLSVPSGQRHELCRGLHAEQNAIIQAALHGVAIEGATVYCDFLPCVICAKMIINAKIKRVVFTGYYPDDLAVQLFTETKIQLDLFRTSKQQIKKDKNA